MLNNSILKVVQISDLHLTKDNSEVFGIRTNVNFAMLLHKLSNDLLDADAIFLTGDLSQDESPESYQLIANILGKISKPIYWIPGNHDCIETMQEIFKSQTNFYNKKVLDTPSWSFIFLNSKLIGYEYGFLPEEELNYLETQLIKYKNKSIAIVMHHHPLKTDTALIDQYMLKNKDEFLNLILQYNVKLIICGHVHGDYSIKHDKITMETSKASCFQFTKGTSKLNIDHEIGCKIFYFSGKGYEAETKCWQA